MNFEQVERTSQSTASLMDTPSSAGAIKPAGKTGTYEVRMTICNRGMPLNATPGSKRVVHFRSAAEFVPHAAWLLTDLDLDPSNCGCQYCHKKGESSEKPRNKLSRMRSSIPALAESGTVPASRFVYASPTPSQTGRTSRKATLGLHQRSVRGVSGKVSLCKLETPLRDDVGLEASPAQLSDLAALAQSRLHRDQELVWYILGEPLRIICQETVHVIHLWPGMIAGTTIRPSPPIEHTAGATEAPEILYFVKVPSLNRTYVVPRAIIVPFQSHRPDEKLIAELRSMGADIPLDAPDCKFDPLPSRSTLETPLPVDTGTKLSPLELFMADVKIANQIASLWSLTDEFSPCPSVRAPSISPSLTISPGKTLKKSPSLTSTRTWRGYRGLWLGAERIWTGDLLILSFPESGINFKRDTAPRFVHTDESPLERRNPEDRQVFLKLRSLTPVVTEGGKRIYATGNLYRLLPSPVSAQESNQVDDTELPQSPDGFVFKPMLSVGIEAKFPVDLIRGRYYSQIISLVDKQSLPEEQMLKPMEGRCRADPAIRRPIKHTKESRDHLLETIRKSVLQVE